MRSLLFVPGHRTNMLEKAFTLPLDVALFDLEDGVPAAEKGNARARIAEALARPRGALLRYVRVNALASGAVAEDLRAAVRAGLDGILLPKVDDPADVRELDAMLGDTDARIMPSVESARGLLRAHEIATASARVVGVLFGSEDYARDLGLPLVREAEAAELLYARSAVVNACAAARVLAFDGIWPVLDDPDGLRRDAIAARRLGFAGKSMIHPAHLETINALFTPTADEVEAARRVVREFEAAQAQGLGALRIGGQMIDAPIVERARRVLEAHAAGGDRGGRG